MQILCQVLADIPSVQDICASVTKGAPMTLVFPFSYTDARYAELERVLGNLTESLPNYSVFYSGRTQTTARITIVKVVDEATVRDHAELFLEVIHDYVTREHELVTQLAVQLKFPAEQISETWIAQLERPQMHGWLDHEWKYYFHGCECRFIHATTGQVVDAVLKDYGKQAHIPDPGFLAEFAKTHAKAQELLAVVDLDFHDMRQVLLVLEREGFIADVPPPGGHRS